VNKKYLIYILPFVLAIILLAGFIGNCFRYKPPEMVLLDVFNTSKAEIISSEIYFWGTLGDNCNNIDKLKELALNISKEMDIESGNPKYISDENDILQKIEVSGVMKGSKETKIYIKLRKSVDAGEEGNISVSIIKDLTGTGLEVIRKTMLGIFKKHDIDVKVNSCITGYLKGRLSDRQINEIGTRMLKSAGASNVEGIRDSDLISISAFSSFIDEAINVNGKKVNLNFAIRYNSYEDRTYIWVATPIIVTEY